MLVLHFLMCIFQFFLSEMKTNTSLSIKTTSFVFVLQTDRSLQFQLLFPAVSDASPVHIIHYFISSCVYISVLIFLIHYVQSNGNKVNHAQGFVAAWNSLFL